jgi:hypothetical protein
MKGKWQGEYTYGEGYPDIYKGKTVAFELNLISNGVEFEGFFKDDETKNIFDTPGTVHGYLENDVVVFSKWYPCLWQLSDTGEMEVCKDFPSHEIYYTGNLIGDHFQGFWEIPAQFVDDLGSYTEIYGSGTWSMRQIST